VDREVEPAADARQSSLTTARPHPEPGPALAVDRPAARLVVEGLFRDERISGTTGATGASQ
jgi:hypothetical protein